MCSPFSDLLAAGLKDETGGNVTSVIPDNCGGKTTSQTCDRGALWERLSSHHQLCVGGVSQHVHQAGTCLRQALQGLAPVNPVGQETLLHPLLLSVHLLQETLLLLLQGFPRCTDLSEDLLPLLARRNLHHKMENIERNYTKINYYSYNPPTSVNKIKLYMFQ